MTEPCPGACNTAWRTIPPGDPGRPEPVPGEPVWCPRDQARIRRQFAELDILGALRAFIGDGHREQAASPSRGNGHPPSPSPAMDDVDELTRWAFSWKDAYLDLHPSWKAAQTYAGNLAEARTETIAWLCERMDGLLEAPFAADFGREVTWWHRSLTTVTKAGTGRHRKLAPCPWCGLRTLYETDGDDYLACCNPGPPACRARLTKDEYTGWAQQAARAVQPA